MIYNKFQDLYLSALGMGCLRLPILNGDSSQLDIPAVEEMVDYAIAQGVNYFDAAYPYHGGKCEEVVGKALRRYPREEIFFCTKFPGFNREKVEKHEEIFEEQLRRTGLEYFDFYLFHSVTENNIDAYLDEDLGLMKYLLRQKEQGHIKHLGFSTHGSLETMKRFLDTYGQYMELCQIQLNYLDWSFQQAQEKVELITSYGLPVWVMEPVRGGALAKLPAEQEATLMALRPDEGIPAWALRFTQSLPEVCVTLSGMSNMDQLRENIETFRKRKPLNLAETAALLGVAEELLKKKTLPCTACRYCTSQCPQELDIPAMIGKYNEIRLSDSPEDAEWMLRSIPEDKRPSACLGCRACEFVCPQKIAIADMMSDFAAMENKG